MTSFGSDADAGRCKKDENDRHGIHQEEEEVAAPWHVN